MCVVTVHHVLGEVRTTATELLIVWRMLCGDCEKGGGGDIHS
jgi:hypothetical protein